MRCGDVWFFPTKGSNQLIVHNFCELLAGIYWGENIGTKHFVFNVRRKLTSNLQVYIGIQQGTTNFTYSLGNIYLGNTRFAFKALECFI